MHTQTIWVLGDQLSPNNAALTAADPASAVVLMIESKARGALRHYHKKKLLLVYSAMRHFANDLRQAGWTVDYHLLTDTPDFESGLKRHLETHHPTSIQLTEPNSFIETTALKKLARKLNTDLTLLPTQQFLCPRADFLAWASPRKRLLMEDHYRRLRKQTCYLMQKNGEPVGGQWNFDHDNRKTFSDWHKAGRPTTPIPALKPDTITREVAALIDTEFADNPGTTENFSLPVDRHHALKWLDNFITHRLPTFGDYEDLMVSTEPVLFHSLISPLINLGLLTPQECAEKAITAYENGHAPLPAVEGFVRQIIGWREYINGIYWLRGPDYAKENALHAHRPLPDWFYHGNVPMSCLNHVLHQVIDTGWNHHIQRLMILGNFCLLAGIRPDQTLRWFTEMYVDANEWVMAANVVGMICHADGGLITTKPYAAGSAYINRMSDYCPSCQFDPKLKTGPQACPFNYLYWNFYDQHADRFNNNPRTSMPVKNWLKRPPKDQQAVRDSATTFLKTWVPVPE
ncbi:cryptochrome/photolyase family protein [Phragmitibacter flavus]|uniref:Cryptochrome/photolyase family protein n=1 Tax=Phragmitibacter flavus TaxID=2576071 RepID=A0A5R8KI10_9BACT|nr:cryptochrome/photolyase family protein [Phragmitibacter flavus]TLD71966.1 cryptochrome/photolyase family protein [Phragmitibacter flavus]